MKLDPILTPVFKNYLSAVTSDLSDLTDLFETHLSQKIQSQMWLHSCALGQPRFPYAPIEGGRAQILETEIYPLNYAAALTKTTTPGPHYLINMPLSFRAASANTQLIHQLATLFLNESFDTTAKASQSLCRRKLAIVIGINTTLSLDSDVNALFEVFIKKITLTQKLALAFFGFFWSPQWAPTDPSLSSPLSAKKAYVILKSLYPQHAKTLLNHLEGPGSKQALRSQIPFQGIRQKILASKATSLFLTKICQKNPTSPIYYGVMDSDCLHLRKGQGLFSKLDQLIHDHPELSALSCGYTVSDEERPVVKLGVKLDMAAREALNSVFPYAAYFPEPGSFFLARKPHQPPYLNQMSFISASSPTLENRRFIQNGIKKGLLTTHCLFKNLDGVTTTTPDRMLTLKNGKILALTPKILSCKSTLQSLRDISQSHASVKGWADNLYVALPFSNSSVTEVTAPMMLLFKAYDPISRALGRIERYHPSAFEKVMTEYATSPLDPLWQGWVSEAKTRLAQIGMPQDLILKVEQAAIKTGQALHQTLAKAMSD